MHILFCAILALISWNSVANATEEKPIVVITTSYNNVEWAKKNITSILTQKYSNFRVIYVDDHSSDGTANLVETLVQEMNQGFRFSLIRNQTRRGTLANIYSAIHSCKDNAIIVSVDGDDWLSDKSVLQKINLAYSTQDIWLTHGTLIEYPQSIVAWSIPIPSDIVEANSFRTYRCPSHLRTFYSWLFKKIEIKDLTYEGDFFQMTGDQAMMFPMIEMAGKHHAFIPEVTYVYNMKNPFNDNKVDPQLQNNLEAYIRGLPPYLPLKHGELK